MNEYITLKTENLSLLKGRFSSYKQLFPSLCGAEVFCADIVAREKPLFKTAEELERLAGFLQQNGVKRLHASYWASPSSFLCGVAAEDLYSHFGSESAVKEYYSDTDGTHLYSRWCQEYALAKATGAQAYVFHLIDYFPIDGVWRFSIARSHVVECMAQIVQTFLNKLEENSLLCENSPVIELENAGWALEYGVQTAQDFEYIFKKVYDKHDKLRISWDINHLLHAIGERDGKGVFMLPKEEITAEMQSLSEKYGSNLQQFAHSWIEYNLLHLSVKNKVCCVHLSDCAAKQQQYFTAGYMEYPLREQLECCEDWAAKESFGENVVLTHYDSHLPLGKGVLNGGKMKELLCELEKENEDICILHELKNSTDLENDLKYQRTQLSGKE